MKFFINSSNKAYLRSLSEEFGVSTNGIRLELNKFENSGFLTSFLLSNKKYYKANIKHPLFNDIHKILLKTTGVDDVLQYILQRIGVINKVYLIGSYSNGLESKIIDFLIVGDSINKSFFLEQIDKVERKINKKIRFIIYDNNEFNYDEILNDKLHPLLIWENDNLVL
tara:strand:- start:321 stop:824 length:504 start_codon:yes stop_codon:yes gene_type:complete